MLGRASGRIESLKLEIGSALAGSYFNNYYRQMRYKPSGNILETEDVSTYRFHKQQTPESGLVPRFVYWEPRITTHQPVSRANV